MALRRIFGEDDEILRKRAREVTKFDDKLACLLDDMKETMINADGIGLAAPQVGLLRRAAIIDADGVYLEMINPKIIKAEGEQIGVEGCLSVNPSKNCKVLRPQEVLLEAYDRHGKKYRKELKDLAARACCHELDHLEGILFYDRKHDEE
ncbi:MAG: peptide deformylase [Christensenellales bacterium]|jgi:peptide deformylase|nr:peptide deformylase [Clostridiales bacterium]